MKGYLLWMVSVIFLFSSCETDFETLAPYKETMIIHGVLRPDTAVQVIRINKAFLGKGDAYVMAKQRDSVNYKPGVLEVTLGKMRQGTPVGDPIPLSEKYITTSPGIFSDQQMVFTTDRRIYSNADTTYRLTVRNKYTGNTVTAETPLVGRMTKNPGGIMKLVETDFTYVTSTVSWQAAQNSRQYNVVLRFRYEEWKKGDTTQKVLKHVDIHLGVVDARKAGESMFLSFPGESFYKNLREHIPYDPTVSRKTLVVNNRFRELQLIFTIIPTELYNYMLVNRTTPGVVVAKPEYTNIQGGLGIFTAKAEYTFEAVLDEFSRKKLYNSDYTNDLGFVQIF